MTGNNRSNTHGFGENKTGKEPSVNLSLDLFYLSGRELNLTIEDEDQAAVGCTTLGYSTCQGKRLI